MNASYQQLDSKAFERYFSGIGHARSVALYLKTARLFLKSFDFKLSELIRHLQEAHERDAVIIAHRLKGSLLTVGGNELANVFRKIETELNPNNHFELLQFLKEHEKAIPIFLQELGDWMKHLESTVTD